MSVEDLIRHMDANPDRGIPCWSCVVTAKDCQAKFILTGHRCCMVCDFEGGQEAHS